MSGEICPTPGSGAGVAFATVEFDAGGVDGFFAVEVAGVCF
jgi:hypothetical protein